MPEERLT